MCSERRTEPRKEPARQELELCCQRVASPIASAKASGIPKSVIEREDEVGRAALRARRSVQERR